MWVLMREVPDFLLAFWPQQYLGFNLALIISVWRTIFKGKLSFLVVSAVAESIKADLRSWAYKANLARAETGTSLEKFLYRKTFKQTFQSETALTMFLLKSALLQFIARTLGLQQSRKIRNKNHTVFWVWSCSTPSKQNPRNTRFRPSWHVVLLKRKHSSMSLLQMHRFRGVCFEWNHRWVEAESFQMFATAVARKRCDGQHCIISRLIYFLYLICFSLLASCCCSRRSGTNKCLHWKLSFCK